MNARRCEACPYLPVQSQTTGWVAPGRLPRLRRVPGLRGSRQQNYVDPVQTEPSSLDIKEHAQAVGVEDVGIKPVDFKGPQPELSLAFLPDQHGLT